MKLVQSFLLVFTIIFTTNMQSQELPYKKIPDAPETYTAGTTLSRMIDALGFRFYWVTEGLTVKDLAFQPNTTARTTEQTVEHILGLSKVILNAAEKKPNDRKSELMTYAEKRRTILENLQKASKIFKNAEDVSQFKIIFGTGEKKTEFPVWNAINGPIADALWHTGQIVSFRRSSGNPIPKGVNMLTGERSEQ